MYRGHSHKLPFSKATKPPLFYTTVDILATNSVLPENVHSPMPLTWIPIRMPFCGILNPVDSIAFRKAVWIPSPKHATCLGLNEKYKIKEGKNSQIHLHKKSGGEREKMESNVLINSFPRFYQYFPKTKPSESKD